MATWFLQTEGRSAERVILGVRLSEFILLEFQSPSRRIFIGSHSLPPLWSPNRSFKEHNRCGRCRPGGEAVVSSINFDTSSSESTWKEHDSACYVRCNIPWNAICPADNRYKIVSMVTSRKKSSSSGPNITIRDVASFRLSQFSQLMPDVFLRHNLTLRK
jgi:hypothetical protein